jgi:hypothetical protein
MMLQFIQQLNGQNFYCTCLGLRLDCCSDDPLQIIMEIRSSRVQGLSMLLLVFTWRSLSSRTPRLSPYVIQVILGAVSVVGTVPALVSQPSHLPWANQTESDLNSI